MSYKKLPFLISVVVLSFFISSFNVNAQTPVSSSLNLTRNLSYGMSGSDVSQLQQFLISQGHLAQGNSTGFFGSLTQAAVQSFQVSQGIASPGIQGYGDVGPKTRGVIANTSISAPVNSSSQVANFNQSAPSSSNISTSSLGNKFRIGDKIQTMVGVYVDYTPPDYTTTRPSGGQPKYSIGTIVAGPVFGAYAPPAPPAANASAHNYYNVDYDSGIDGWTRELDLEGYTAPINPTLPTITSFSATPMSINIGKKTSILLRWASINTNVCTGNFGNSKFLNLPSAGQKTINTTDFPKGGFYLVMNLDCFGTSPVVAREIIHIPVVDPSTPTAPNINFFATSPSTIQAGEYSTLSWSSSNATSCTASGGWTGTKSAFGSQNVTPTSTTNYTLNCSNSSGSVSSSLTINVNPPAPLAPVITIKANNSDGPLTVSYQTPVTLSWTSSRPMTSCNGTYTGGTVWGGGLSSSGSTVLPLTAQGTMSFTITCYDSITSKNISDKVAVIVNGGPGAPKIDILANGSQGPVSLSPGQSVNLSWSSTGATTGYSCRGANVVFSDPWFNSQPLNGTFVASPTKNTVYVIGCQDSAANYFSDSVSVNVTPTSSLDSSNQLASVIGTTNLSQQLEAANPANNLIVNTQILNVRSGAGADNVIVSKVYLNNVLNNLGLENGWYKVSLLNGQVGYVHSWYVRQ